jgi:hypothetical protein
MFERLWCKKPEIAVKKPADNPANQLIFNGLIAGQV